MNNFEIPISELVSESDVEQKVIYPLLTGSEPEGLGYDHAEIKTKSSLRKLNIDKGGKSTLYYPDYLISVAGVPSLVLEAKKPGEDLQEAFRQAALYATEINRQFPSKLNPCALIVASDGKVLVAGSWDSATPDFEIEVAQWNISDSDFSAFCERFARSAVLPKAELFRSKVRPSGKYKRPLNLLGGKYIQDRTYVNSYGENISIQYRHLFNPNVEAERIDIVQNAYVKVAKHQSHVSPIDKLIRKKVSAIADLSTEIEDNTNPREIVDKLKRARDYNNQVLLLIGSVGAGKSTFSTYLKEVALKRLVQETLQWITVDLNNAPVNADEIYRWLKTEIIGQIKKTIQDRDLERMDFIQDLYKEQIDALKKGPLSLLPADGEVYAEKLYEAIVRFQQDIDVTLSSYIGRFVHDTGKELVIVLDNCDKRSLHEQLLMFEVANWIKQTIKAIVFLPLRDTTFDHFRLQKPLDTAIKDLTFRIVPPSLEKVLYERVKYASRLSDKAGNRSYVLPNGIRVEYPSHEELSYLRSILKSLFQSHFFRRLISGLAGGNIRVGLEIFLDFCKSGYINEADIFQMRSTKGEYVLPNHKISKVFLRGNRQYYNDTKTRIRNVFASDPTDALPDPFVRISVLKWLHERYQQRGPSGIKGFHKLEALFSDLTALGHDRSRLEKELLNLLRSALVVNESQDATRIDNEELLSINSPGTVHLELVTNLDYLSACAEDCWFADHQVADTIHREMAGRYHLSLLSVIKNSKALVEYLNNYFDRHFKLYETHVGDKTFESPLNFGEILELLDDRELRNSKFSRLPYSVGETFRCEIARMTLNGLVLIIDGKIPRKIFVNYSEIPDQDLVRNARQGDFLEGIVEASDKKTGELKVSYRRAT